MHAFLFVKRNGQITSLQYILQARVMHCIAHQTLCGGLRYEFEGIGLPLDSCDKPADTNTPVVGVFRSFIVVANGDKSDPLPLYLEFKGEYVPWALPPLVRLDWMSWSSWSMFKKKKREKAQWKRKKWGKRPKLSESATASNQALDGHINKPNPF